MAPRNRPRFVVFVESPLTGAGQDCAKFLLEQGVTPLVLAASPDSMAPSLRCDFADLNVEIRSCDTRSVDAVVAACRKIEAEGELVGVTSVYEYYCDIGAEVASRLGLAGPDPAAVTACRSKASMRRAMAGTPGLNPLFRLCASREEAVTTAAEFGFPVVVKPLDLTGSLWVRRCDSTDQVAAITEEIMWIGEYLGQKVTPQVVVEECVPGDEYSAEVMHGQVLGLTEKICSEPPFFLEMGHIFPAPVSGARERLLLEKVEQAVKAIGVTWGPAHVELKLTADGEDARVIEVNGRIAGDRIPELVRVASGVDMCRLHMTALIGGTPDLTLDCDRTAVVHFLMSASLGRLDAIDGVAEAESTEGVHEVHMRPGVQPGMVYRANGSNRDRAAWVIAEGAGRDEALSRAKEAGQKLVFSWSPLDESEGGA